MVSLLAPGLCLLCAIASPVASPGLSPAAPIRTVYFTAADASGEPVRGLKADDLSLSENGLPRPILELKESPDHLQGSPRNCADCSSSTSTTISPSDSSFAPGAGCSGLYQSLDPTMGLQFTGLPGCPLARVVVRA